MAEVEPKGVLDRGHLPTVGTMVQFRDLGELWPALVLRWRTDAEDTERRVDVKVFTTSGDRVEYGVPYDENRRVHRTWGWLDRMP